LAVDLDGLAGFANRLESIRGRMNGTRTLIDGYDGKLGSERVESALGKFESGWKDGRKKIDNNLERLSALAGQAVVAIRQTDTDLGDRLGESTERHGEPVVEA
jgi:hypothetical protein